MDNLSDNFDKVSSPNPRRILSIWYGDRNELKGNQMENNKLWYLQRKKKIRFGIWAVSRNTTDNWKREQSCRCYQCCLCFSDVRIRVYIWSCSNNVFPTIILCYYIYMYMYYFTVKRTPVWTSRLSTLACHSRSN